MSSVGHGGGIGPSLRVSPCTKCMLGNWLLRLTPGERSVALLYHGIDTRQGDRGSERRAFVASRATSAGPTDSSLQRVTVVSARRRGQRFPGRPDLR